MLTMTAPKCLAPWVAGVAATLLAGALAAQPVYRIVGADGRVTYADQPPALAGQNKISEAGRAPEADATLPLPLSLRAAVNQYPVTLYTTANCTPCATGRALLVRRGIPFTEKTIISSEDAEALQSLSGENALPLLAIGAQQIKGWTETQWQLFLDAAGYPKSSQLPRTYRLPVASPLVALVTPAVVPAEQGSAANPDTPRAQADAPPYARTRQPVANPGTPTSANKPNPAGIRF
ncbi:MAG: glutaredoxin family protein [Burkholderiales bacterium]|nr:glutaredoxin family protein [Burkholderiales bacterium]